MLLQPEEGLVGAALRAGLAIGLALGFLVHFVVQSPIDEAGALVAAAALGHGVSALLGIRRRDRARRLDERDQVLLLQVARDRGGLLTPVYAAVALNVPPARAQDLLDELARQGLARVEVDEEHGVLYVVDALRLPALQPA